VGAAVLSTLIFPTLSLRRLERDRVAVASA
jgi:hypothetical protein